MIHTYFQCIFILCTWSCPHQEQIWLLRRKDCFQRSAMSKDTLATARAHTKCLVCDTLAIVKYQATSTALHQCFMKSVSTAACTLQCMWSVHDVSVIPKHAGSCRLLCVVMSFICCLWLLSQARGSSTPHHSLSVKEVPRPLNPPPTLGVLCRSLFRGYLGRYCPARDPHWPA